MNNASKLFPNGPDAFIRAGQKKILKTVILIAFIMVISVLWGCFGYITVTKRTIAVSEDGTLYVVISPDFISSVGIGTKFTINGVEYTSDFEPFEVYHPLDASAYSHYMSGLSWVPQISKTDYLSNFGIKESPLPEGWYVAEILVDRCHPIKLLMK